MELDSRDLELVAAAEKVMADTYRPFWHTVAAALRTADGRIWTGVHLGAAVGRMSVCAEAVALGRAILEGQGPVVAAVAVRHPKPEEESRAIAVVAPCGACREMFLDHAPDAWVIVPGPNGLEKLRVPELLPAPYRR
ncbi:MAG: cytidine deaminase [Rhodospirillales bacterium]|nr:cytidine deaminase [Rhodospirillales bacterium]MDE2200113.1 cytidine deaminase [Rhodospirillales bacterium]MDE2574738.1 cytidine deaminase [Rhodospirillales bacterium]